MTDIELIREAADWICPEYRLNCAAEESKSRELRALADRMEAKQELIYTCSCDAYLAKIAELKAQLAKYKADAERYRWLSEHNASWSWMPSRFNKEIVSGFAVFDTAYFGYTFDKAIDAAIAKVKP